MFDDDYDFGYYGENYYEQDAQPEDELTQEEFDGSGYSSDKEENRKNRVRDVSKCVDRAKELYENQAVKDAVDSILSNVVRNNDVGFTSSEFKCDLKRALRRGNVCIDGRRVIVNDHVSTVIIRIACAENKSFIDYAPISKAECDAWLYDEEPDKYEWLNSSLYGGALKERNQICA